MDRSVGRVTRSSAVVFAVTLQRLLDDPDRDWAPEEEIVLDALRRSTSKLEDATPEQLANYLGGLSNEQLRGVISNVKGIYHEMLFAAAENVDGDGITAILPEETNQPGYDIEFVVDGEVIETVQLKAVASPDYIYEHLARYPGIDVVATEEVAAMIDGVKSSGFTNVELEDRVRDTLTKTYGNTLSAEMLEAASTSLLVGAAFAAKKALQDGRIDGRELKAAMGDLGVGLTTAIALDVLLTGGA